MLYLARSLSSVRKLYVDLLQDVRLDVSVSSNLLQVSEYSDKVDVGLLIEWLSYDEHIPIAGVSLWQDVNRFERASFREGFWLLIVERREAVVWLCAARALIIRAVLGRFLGGLH